MAFFNRANSKDGILEFIASQAGVHRVCFDNTMSRWTAKVVTFTVGSFDDTANSDHGNIAQLEHLGPMVDSVIKVSDELDAIERLQHTMRVREQNHRDTSAAINSRVQWMAVVESALLITISVAQLFYIKTWFSDNVKRGRV
jgi:hypothetical protein